MDEVSNAACQCRAFPTHFYADYPSSYTICGTLPTTISGAATCINHPCASGFLFDNESPVLTYPSHPPLPEPSQSVIGNLGSDPKGLTWDAVWVSDLSDYTEELQPLLPNLGVWNCTLWGLLEEPAVVKQVALYLTATSTSTEAHQDSSTEPILTPSVVRSEAAVAIPENTPASGPSSSNTALALAPHEDTPVAAQLTTTTAMATPTTDYSDDEVKMAPSPPQTPAIVLTSTNAQETAMNTAATLEVSTPISEIATPQLLPNVIFTLGNPPQNTQSSPASPATTVSPTLIHDQTASVDANTQISIANQPLTPSLPITLGSGTPTTPIAPPASTIGSQAVTANSQNQSLDEGQTLTPGGGVTASGTLVSLAASATEVFVGSTTQGLGGLILSGLSAGPSGGSGGGSGDVGTGGGSANANATGVLAFAGGVEGVYKGLRCCVGLVIGLMAMVIWL